MDHVMSHVRPASQPAGCLTWQKLWHWTVCTNFATRFVYTCYATMLIGTIDFYHITPLSLTLISAGGHKVSTKQNVLLYFLVLPSCVANTCGIGHYAQTFKSGWMEFVVMLRLVDMMNLILNLSLAINSQGREPCLYDFDIENKV